MVLDMRPPDDCACSKDQEPAGIGQEQADRRIPDDAECPHLPRLFSECFQDKALVNPLCGGCHLRQETAATYSSGASLAVPCKIPRQRLPGVRLLHSRHLLGCALGYDAAAFFAAFGAEVDDPV